jgi:hypothetical protein
MCWGCETDWRFEARNSRAEKESIADLRRTRGLESRWYWVQSVLETAREHTEASTSSRDDDASTGFQLGKNNCSCPGGDGRGGARAPCSSAAIASG